VGNGWAKDSSGAVALQYVFGALTSKVPLSSVQGEIQRAFREWEKYGKFTLTQATQANAARSVAILFGSRGHGDAYPFDGPGGVLAHTFYPPPNNSEPIAGDMHFDADESWNIGSYIDVFSVALHEAGHALGLGHSSVPGSVMYPYYKFSTGLTSDDIAGIQALYGAAGTNSSTPPTTGTTPPVKPPVTPPVSAGTPPMVTIVSPNGTIVATQTSTIHLTGTASAGAGLASVKWSTSNGDAGAASGTTSWSANVPLLVGNTVITVRAYDTSGNSAWRSLTVVRQ